MEENNNNNNNNKKPDLRDTDVFKFLNKFKFTIVTFLLIFGLGYLSYYTVDANEKAVILRLGKYHDTVGPGLHFRIPLIDNVEKVIKIRIIISFIKSYIIFKSSNLLSDNF